MLFSDKDLQQIKSHDLDTDNIQQQIKNFEQGFPFVDIVKPAISGDGVVLCDDKDIEKFTQIYDAYAKTHKIVKFVPASGAATRMFKDLFDFASTGNMNTVAEKTIKDFDKFAFYDETKSNDSDIINNILNKYGNMPKGLIPFHKYKNIAKTPVEEHLTEGAKYATSDNTVYIHFTVSPEHRQNFNELLNRVVPFYESEYGIKYDISMSEQKKSTDTIAVNLDNTPFRNPDGSLLFRPAGHGALIENLNDINADLIFIKNIDNVSCDCSDTVKHKKLLAGILVSVQSKIFDLIHKIDNGNTDIETVHNFITNEIGVKLNGFLSMSEYKDILNRPLRVCGVVKNSGEPGGGPFWVRDKSGKISLQIVESSQIAPESKDIMKESEYFNPVDLICAPKDYNGNKFDLTKYIDENTGFISEKSKNGKSLRAMERPGLWNGAMANWNTILVAVPASTFSPVKVVTDLLKDAHQVK